MCQAWFGLRAWVWAVLESAHSGLLILEPDVTCNVMYNTTSLEYIYIYIYTPEVMADGISYFDSS
jgi:hypothetical protein